jgi:hypothetical protein
MSYKAGQTVIVTVENVNHVGVILDKYVVNKQTLYDVLLENRSALIMLSTGTSKNTFINKSLTERLCDSEVISTTIPYKTLVENDELPICRA